MSEHIVHTGILEDSFAIAPYLPQIPADYEDVIKNHLGFARLGCITVSGDQFSFRLLEEWCPQWSKRDDCLKAKLAFVLGWISHRACDRQMKPIWNISEMMARGSDANPKLSPTECSVYHEAELYNLYYKDDPTFRLSIFPEELKACKGAELFDIDMAMEYAESSFGVNMMNIQTFSAKDEGQIFIENVCIRAQKFYVDVSRYTKDCGTPDPALRAEYVTDIDWYNKDDEIIKVANKLRDGGTSSPEECEAALKAIPSSHYAQALKKSLEYIVSAAEYFNDPDMSMDTLKDRLDIGKLGRKGLGV